ncbi:DUF4232 domain-containing protein [Actinoplanes sichuanensis]|uniref:DUF4232 domain-containing protein n=1 Tax=Actinoplanes sichuanensis TaxID=512349 RepID=A0ABW4ASK6_9ACTN|nr:DUF4232 domain-containing protein [Actinoplanes sichuanensis]
MNIRRNVTPPLLAGALLTALSLTGCAAPGATPETGRSTPARPAPSPSVTRTADPVPRCIDGLEISIGGKDAASGLRAVGLDLRNCGGKPYQIKGYPVVKILDEDRRPLELRVLHGVGEVATLPPWQVEPKQVTIAPGASATALLVWRNLTTDAETVAVGRFVRVAPGDGRAEHLLALHVDAGNTGEVAISPWTGEP